MNKVNKSAEIRKAMLDRFPSRQSPHGALANIAREYAVTEALVRRIAKELGVRALRQRPSRTYPKYPMARISVPDIEEARDLLQHAARAYRSRDEEAAFWALWDLLALMLGPAEERPGP